jgi:Tfp pilus assembly protein PilF
MNTRILTAAMLLSLTCGAPNCLGYRGHFPGKGSEDDWRRAAKLTNAGVDAEEAHNGDLAVNLHKQAIAIYPYDPDFYNNLALAYENAKGDLPNAIKYFKIAIQMAPADLDFRLNWAGMLSAQRKFEEADRALGTAKQFAKTPDDLAAWERLKHKIDAKRKACEQQHPNKN